jgi:hypothetical protein
MGGDGSCPERACRHTADGQRVRSDTRYRRRPLAPFTPAGKANVLLFVQTDCPISNSYAPENSADLQGLRIERHRLLAGL